MLPTLKIKLARDADIIAHSCGEVIAFKAYNFKYNVAQPVPGGLFCQKIFGPLEDYTCACGTHWPKFQVACPTCGVPILPASERSNRCGHINTVAHFINPFILKLLSNCLGISNKDLEGISLGHKFFRIQKSDNEYARLVTYRGKHKYIEIVDEDEGGQTSVESLYKALKREQIDGKKTLEHNSNPGVQKYLEEGYTLYDFFNSVVQVPPAAYRDISMFDDRVTYHPVNNIYLRILRQGLRISHILEAGADGLEDLIPYEACILQHVINMLMITGGVDYYGNDICPVIETLASKEGLIRGNILGKRVDFSGRSVISSGPELPLDTIGLPFEMAYELMKPFIIHELIEFYKEDFTLVNPFKLAYQSYRKKDLIARICTEQCAKEARVMMNRAPSLHRYSVMSFKIVLHEGKQIKVPPMVCSPFNADFDGDTVAIHLILSDKAIEESEETMTPACNVMSSIFYDKPNLLPAHEQIVGLYELTK